MPWTIDECPDAHGHVTIRRDDDIEQQPIATVYGCDGDAKLIAAAPDLLATLTAALEFIERRKADLIGVSCSGYEYEKAIKPGFDALAKALR